MATAASDTAMATAAAENQSDNGNTSAAATKKPRAKMVKKAKETPQAKRVRISTGVCKRLVKETNAYMKEVAAHKAKLAKMQEANADESDMKNQRMLLAESEMMVPDCRARLENVCALCLCCLQLCVSPISSFKLFRVFFFFKTLFSSL